MLLNPDELFFTIVEEDVEHRIPFFINKTETENFVQVGPYTINSQQAAEIGMLLLAIALPSNPDLSSGLELIEGYDIPIPEELIFLA